MAHDGKMNEGIISTQLGLKGMPAIAEELMIARDLMLAEYNNCAIHIGGLSSKGSVDLIRKAKQKGIKVTCDVHAANLFLEDNLLTGFDTNYKVMPPLRTAEDRQALIAGLMDDTIDVICSDHTPHDIESKMVEFDVAAFGMIGLESFWGVVNTSLSKQLSIDKIIQKITYNPRQILNIAVPKIKVNEKANLTAFNLDEKWIFSLNDIYSKSKNTAFIGTKFTGKVVQTIANK
jgi:dihydroorotase